MDRIRLVRRNREHLVDKKSIGHERMRGIPISSKRKPKNDILESGRGFGRNTAHTEPVLSFLRDTDAGKIKAGVRYFLPALPFSVSFSQSVLPVSYISIEQHSKYTKLKPKTKRRCCPSCAPTRACPGCLAPKHRQPYQNKPHKNTAIMHQK